MSFYDPVVGGAKISSAWSNQVEDALGSGTPLSSASYTIWVSSSVYYARNGQTGKRTSDSSLSTLVNGCISALGTAGVGGIIYFKEGLYVPDAPITVNQQYIRLIGAGRYATYFLQDAGSALTSYIDISKDWCSISHMGFRGHATTEEGDYGVYLSSSDADYFAMDHCYIGHFTKYLFYASSNNGVMNIHDNYIGWADTTESGSAGMMLSGTADSFFHHNSVAGGEYAIRCSTIGSSIFTGNKLFGVAKTYFWLSYPWRCILNGNIIGGASPTGTDYNILVDGTGSNWGQNNVISNNVIYQDASGKDAICLNSANCQFNEIKGNTFEAVAAGKYAFNEVAGDYNIFTGNNIDDSCSGTVSITGAHTRVNDNLGYNPVGKVASPFDTTNDYVEMAGDQAFPDPSTTYTVTNLGVILSSTDSGNADNAIQIKDNGGNNINPSTLSTLDCYFLPVGYQINWGAYTGAAPTVVASFI